MDQDQDQDVMEHGWGCDYGCGYGCCGACERGVCAESEKYVGPLKASSDIKDDL